MLRLRPLSQALVALALIGSLGLPADMHAEPVFRAPFYGSDVGLFPKAVAVADFNEDGRQDLVVANIRDTASVLLGRGDGTFLPRNDIAAGSFPSGVAAGDMNGDGHQDIVIASVDAVYVILGYGNGTFRDKMGFQAGAPFSISLGDLNGDGRLDVVAGDVGSRTVVVLLGIGDGTLGVASHYGGGLYAYSLSLGDMTHDGRLDVVAVDYFTASLTVLPGNADGTLSAGRMYGVGDSPQSLSIGDVNGDGFSDVAVANSGALAGSSSLSLLLGRADGSLAPHVELATDVWPSSVSLEDLNADGQLDLVVSGGTYSHAVVYIGRGDATFTRAHEFVTAIGPHGQQLADMNGDGRPDLIEADMTHTVVVHLGNDDGSFGTVMPVGAGTVDASWVALGDVSSDGHSDLVAGGYETRAVSLLFGRGDGTFDPSVPFDVGEYTTSAVLGDLNHDQHLDLILNTFSSIAVFLGNGDGSFGPKARYAVGTFPREIALADLDQDGHADVAFVTDDKIAIILGKGDGTFGEIREFPAGEHSISTTVADLNRDGIPDLAVAKGGPYSEAGPTGVAILLGNGDGSFQEPRDFTVPGVCTAITSGDFNGDRILDLAVSDGSNNNVTGKAAWVALGNGDGTFQTPVGFGDGGYAQKILTADWDGDGHLDLAVGDTRTVYVLAGSGDGTFEPDGHCGAAGSSSMAMGDVDLDGRVDIAAPTDAFDAMQGIVVLLNLRGEAAALAARVFLRDNARTVPIGAGAPQLCVYIEPISGNFEASSIDPSNVVMSLESSGASAQIHSTASKHPITEDVDRNGVSEVRICFSREDLGTLLGGIRGRQTVQVLLEGSLRTGGQFQGALELFVVGTGHRAGQVSVWPNPLNPVGVISFETSRPGSAKLTIYDISGRLVRTLMDLPVLPSGPHEVHIDARGSRGNPLASGVYFYRTETVDGVVTGRFTILK